MNMDKHKKSVLFLVQVLQLLFSSEASIMADDDEADCPAPVGPPPMLATSKAMAPPARPKRRVQMAGNVKKHKEHEMSCVFPNWYARNDYPSHDC